MTKKDKTIKGLDGKNNCKISKLEVLMEGSQDIVNSWPSLVYKSMNPTMFFILHKPKDGDRRLYMISKEKWFGLHALLSSKPLPGRRWYHIQNLTKSSIYEEPIDIGDAGTFIFSSRKNWIKLFIISIAFVVLVVTLFSKTYPINNKKFTPQQVKQLKEIVGKLDSRIKH